MGNIRFERINLDPMQREVDKMYKKVDIAIKGVMTRTGDDAVAHMKATAPWNDDTTNARNGLHMVPDFSDNDRFKITLSHTVPYGIWLEIANSGKYQIIMPTVKGHGDLMMQRLTRILGKLGAR